MSDQLRGRGFRRISLFEIVCKGKVVRDTGFYVFIKEKQTL